MVGCMTEDIDKDTFTFIPLATAIANVVRYLDPKEKPKQDAERPEPEDEVRNPKADRDYIESGLARIRRFERDAAGIKGRR